MAFHQLDNSQGNFHYNAYIYSDTCWQPHFHACYELICSVRGNCKVSLNGDGTVLEECELVLVPPYTVHSLVIPKDAETWVGVFSEDFVEDFSKKNRLYRFSKFTCDENVWPIIKDNLLYQGTPEHYMAIGCLNMVCGQCIKNSVLLSAEKSGELNFKVIDYISRNLRDDITLKDIADSLKYEYHYFSSLFHSCFQVNFKSFVNMLRFEKACGMLSDKSMDITRVCSECGFGSIRNFNRVFRQMSGITPGAYRKNFTQGRIKER